MACRNALEQVEGSLLDFADDQATAVVVGKPMLGTVNTGGGLGDDMGVLRSA